MRLAPILFLMLAAPVSALHAQTAADSASIRQAALDYIEGWYTGDAERVARAVHPALAKRNVHPDPESGRSTLREMSADELVESTREGGGRDTPRSELRQGVDILDIYERAASVRIAATDFVDYLHLAKADGRWAIINVLTELRPEAP
ncbi:MAG: nuclear transport factor 2 family protein [Gemmatimonadota bacterium]